MIAGADALAPAHEALADPSAPDEARIALLQVLGEIGDPRSVQPVIRFTRRNADSRTYLGAELLDPRADATLRGDLRLRPRVARSRSYDPDEAAGAGLPGLGPRAARFKDRP